MDHVSSFLSRHSSTLFCFFLFFLFKCFYGACQLVRADNIFFPVRSKNWNAKENRNKYHRASSLPKYEKKKKGKKKWIISFPTTMIKTTMQCSPDHKTHLMNIRLTNDTFLCNVPSPSCRSQTKLSFLASHWIEFYLLYFVFSLLQHNDMRCIYVVLKMYNVEDTWHMRLDDISFSKWKEDEKKKRMKGKAKKKCHLHDVYASRLSISNATHSDRMNSLKNTADVRRNKKL